MKQSSDMKFWEDPKLIPLLNSLESKPFNLFHTLEDLLGENTISKIISYFLGSEIPNGTYRLGEKTDVKKLGFNGFSSGASGFLDWNGQLFIYHPVLGAYQIILEKAWTPKKHFGVDMLDKTQVHTWATVEDVSVDPTYFDLWPTKYPSPIGSDQ